jgi:uncharacterized protein YgbK (DUF1537 family)
VGNDDVLRSTLLDQLPTEWQEDLFQEIQSLIQRNKRKVVVLDDDPTGTQTVHDIYVLTEWSVETLVSELKQDYSCFYLLTNSRSLSISDAKRMVVEIGHNLVIASRRTGRRVVVISRSDSTLRGHFPEELDALSRSMEIQCDGWLLIPFFLEGGRYTIADIHYVTDKDKLIPVGKTGYANDNVFGFRSSNLRDWVEEKTQGRIKSSSVASISIEDIRLGGPEAVKNQLLRLKDSTVCIVNAASYRDLEVFVLGLLEAENSGRNFLYRTAASLVQVRSGICPRTLLSRADLQLKEKGGGLLIAGSYVSKTTRQLEALRATKGIVEIEIDAQKLGESPNSKEEIARVSRNVNKALGAGLDTLVYTSRELISSSDANTNITIGKRISKGLVNVVRNLQVAPRYILAKGGITASDIASTGLAIKKALVLGQIQPGVPVWQLGPESRYPGMHLIVFPGNVGGSQALVEIVKTLSEVRVSS